MEDEYFLSDEGRFAAVFDGHGGGGVSSYLRDRLYEKFQQHMRAYESDHDESGNHGSSYTSYPSIPSQVAAFRLAFDEVEKEVCMNEDLQYQGSTAVAVAVHEDADGTRTLLSANVGDSRAILSRRRRAIDLTRDHKPNDEREKARILGMGEHIEWDHYCKVHRVRNLSLSRAIGDRFAKPAVSGEVEIKRFPVVEGADEFILLASDGLWDVMSSQDVVSFVHKRLSAPLKFGNQAGDAERAMDARRRNMSRFVANEALKRGSGDNVCVVMVWLKDANQ
jgi:serine/threonine protein phosphatase PrpC